MAFFDSNVSTFKLDDTGAVQRNLSAYINDIDGLPGDRNLNDATALGDTGRKRHPSLEDGQFTISGMYDNTATSGPDVVLSGVRTHTAAVDFEYSPDGTIVYSGTCWCDNYTVRSAVGNLVEFSASFQVQGTVSRA